MSLYALDEGSHLLRLEYQVTKAVHHRGLFTVLRVAIAASWNRPRLPKNLSPRLRADMGFPPQDRLLIWPAHTDDPRVPLPIWMPRL